MKTYYTDKAILPKGFLVGGLHTGVRRRKKDLAILHTSKPATTAGVFTQNIVQAAPVVVSKEQLAKSNATSAIVINSGNANACTGNQGIIDAWQMIDTTASSLHLSREEVLVASTGVIGKHLPMKKILPGITKLSQQLCKDTINHAAEAITTTDLTTKKISTTILLSNQTKVTLTGIAKGSGMIAPNMATMLAFVMTDASISHTLLQNIVSSVTDQSFNRISVDGQQSTNDTVIVLANGLAANPTINKKEKDYDIFYEAIKHLFLNLAKMIVKDGEGASKFIEILAKGLASENDAVKICQAIANSNLVKTAIYGEDPNWGRIISAIGCVGVEFNPENVEMLINEIPILNKGYRITENEPQIKTSLKNDVVKISVNLHHGNHEATFWTCDLTEKYISINAGYRT